MNIIARHFLAGPSRVRQRRACIHTVLRTLACTAIALLAVPLTAATSLATPVEGPYVIRNAAGMLEAWSVEMTADGVRKDARAVAPGSVIAVPAAGTVPSFNVTIRSPAATAPDTVETRRNAPLLVIADTHGEYEILVQMLKAQRVVTDQLHWNFGRGHLVILGDVFDRGAHQTEILWLIYALEAQAHQAGGGVHFLLGNHEVMALHGDARYLNPRYAQTAAVFGLDSYAALFDGDSVLGQWLRSKAAVIRIDDALYLHGGIAPEIVERELTLQDINTAIRQSWDAGAVTAGRDRERIGFLLGTYGPLWYRGYFPDANGHSEASASGVDRILKHFGVRRIFVGHTRVPTITPLFDGKVIAVQVYPQRDASGAAIFEALRVQKKEILRALPDGRTEPLL